jgi:hypothetical protein
LRGGGNLFTTAAAGNDGGEPAGRADAPATARRSPRGQRGQLVAAVPRQAAATAGGRGFRDGPKNEPARAGTRCARSGASGDGSAKQLIDRR